MEILFWLQPIFSTFCILGLTFGFILFASFFFALIYLKGEDPEDEDGWGRFSKKMIKAAVCVTTIAILASPLADVKDIYKNILIYRGLNSALVDKAANTADKMLEVLNKELDAELEE